jgi:hypothetical protein
MEKYYNVKFSRIETDSHSISITCEYYIIDSKNVCKKNYHVFSGGNKKYSLVHHLEPPQQEQQQEQAQNQQEQAQEQNLTLPSPPSTQS